MFFYPNSARTSFTNLILNQWYNVITIVDGSNSKFYVNGNEVGTSTSYTPVNTLGVLDFGRYPGGTQYFEGKLSNVQIFNTALPSTGSNSIETLYNNGSPLTSMSGFTSLQAWYKLDASEIYNSSTTEWSIDNNQNPSAYPSSLNFVSSESDFVNIPYNANYDLTGSQTCSFWFNQPASQSGGSYAITFGSGSQIKFYIQFYDPIGRIRVKLFDGGGGDIEVTNLGVSYVSNGWHHIAFTTDATTASDKVIVYFDGVPLSVKGTLSNSGVRVAGTSGFYLEKYQCWLFQWSNVKCFLLEYSFITFTNNRNL